MTALGVIRTYSKANRKQARIYKTENEERAARVRAFLLAEYNADSEGCETALVDLLADIRHLCDKEEIAFHEADKSAHAHYSVERVSARTGITG